MCGSVHGRFLSRLAVGQLRHVSTVPAPVHRMRVPDQLHHVPRAVTPADRPVSYDMRPGVSLDLWQYRGLEYIFKLVHDEVPVFFHKHS